MPAEKPGFEGPRERLLSLGPDRLSDVDLLTVLLSPGTRDLPGDRLARRVLMEFGTLHGLQERRAGELASIRGLGVAKACRVVAAAELGRRALRQRGRLEVLQTAADVGRRCEYLSHEKDELFLAIAVNGRNRVVGEWEVARGWESGVNLTPRQVFTLLVKEGATRVVFVHNHPSGDPDPSQEDIQFTARLLEAARSLGIRVLDHVIVATDGFSSLRETVGDRLEFNRV